MVRVYLDHAATTPLCSESRLKIADVASRYGNPSSLHLEGRIAKALIDDSREAFATKLGAMFAEVIFTGSGSESCALAIVGAAMANQNSHRNQIVLSMAEHHCVLGLQTVLERLGYEVRLCRVDKEAKTDLDQLSDFVSDQTLLVSVMHANNEFGTINPITQVVELAHSHGVLVHTDAVQSFAAREPFPHQADLVSIAAHKFGGPKGVGILRVKAGTPIKPIAGGGGQERELRAGTENTLGIVGAAAALGTLESKYDLAHLRNRLERELGYAGAEPTVVNSERVSGITMIKFPGREADSLLIQLDRLGVSAGSGAACSSGSVEPSHVMLAAGYTEKEAKSAIRFSLGAGSTEQNINEAITRIKSIV